METMKTFHCIVESKYHYIFFALYFIVTDCTESVFAKTQMQLFLIRKSFEKYLNHFVCNY